MGHAYSKQGIADAPAVPEQTYGLQLAGERLFPKDIASVSCCVSDIERFAASCHALGVRYIGLCCGNSGTLTRALAMSLGRSPPAARFTCAVHLSSRDLWGGKNGSNKKSEEEEDEKNE